VAEYDLARGFRDVDNAADAGAFVAYLAAAKEALGEHLTRSIAALDLRPGDAVLDAGCGTGDALLALADVVGDDGRVVGVDVSSALVAEARERTAGRSSVVDVVQADLHALPFGAASFTGCRTERVLLHVEDPARAVAELARVARPGGRVVVTEPDWDTLIIDSDDLAMARRVARAAADRILQPDVARRLPRLAARAGLEVLELEFLTVAFRDPRLAVDLMCLRGAAESLDDPAAVAWWDDLERRAAREPFLAAMSVAMLVARKPS
jgi:ubiquinone/menaquinone biosynthesis C-methylase UbiE